MEICSPNPAPLKRAGKLAKSIIINSAANCQIVLKYHILVQYGTPRRLRNYENLLSVKSKMVDGPVFQPLNRNNSAADCQISPKFGTAFGHVTADTKCPFQILYFYPPPSASWYVIFRYCTFHLLLVLVRNFPILYFQATRNTQPA